MNYRLSRSTKQGFAAAPLWNIDFVNALKQDRISIDPYIFLPHYSRFSLIYRAGCHVIHGIENLYEGVSRGQIQIYIGRTAATSLLDNMKKKVTQSFDGMVPFCSINSDIVTQSEKWAIAVAMKQKEHNALCVADVLNKRPHGGGPIVSDVSIIYLAWKIKSYNSIVGFSTAEDIRNISDDLSKEIQDIHFPGLTALKNSLAATKRVSSKHHLYWDRNLIKTA